MFFGFRPQKSKEVPNLLRKTKLGKVSLRNLEYFDSYPDKTYGAPPPPVAIRVKWSSLRHCSSDHVLVVALLLSSSGVLRRPPIQRGVGRIRDSVSSVDEAVERLRASSTAAGIPSPH